MTDQEILHRLRVGFETAGGHYSPVLYLRRVDEPEFGCEGRPEEGPIYGTIYGVSREGPFRMELEDWMILLSGMDDNMFIGVQEDGGLCCMFEDGSFRPLPDGPWTEKLGLHRKTEETHDS